MMTVHGGIMKVNDFHLHMAYWKAFDFTSRLMPDTVGEKTAQTVRKWE